MIKRTNSAAALILAAIMIIMPLIPAASVFADGNTVTISDAGDFTEFARKCKTDTWSRGKTVVLTGNIDLTGTDFFPVPTFGGSFNGNGYTISGVNITAKGSNLGLFRYIQKGGIVENLNVSGNVAPEGTKKHVGGIVGENSGTLNNCSFSGSVAADDYVGGICGSVTESGRVYGCRFDGSVTGSSYTGGIAGSSYGVIERCENGGSINTTDTETAKSIQDIDIDLSELGTTESIDTSTDTGGICGFSKGRVIGCVNRGDVGYKSIGYNTGGICGRQAGFLSGCENYGTINGRKDIGGICGQAEPYILLEYTEDMLKQINDVFSRIQNIIDNNSLSGDNRLGDSFDRIDGKVAAASDSVEVLSGDAEKYADDIAASVNDFSDRLHEALDSMSYVFDDISDGSGRLADGADSFKESGDYLRGIVDALENAAREAEDADSYLNGAAVYLEKASERISAACGVLEDGVSSLEDGAKKLQDAVYALSNALKNKENTETKFNDIWTNLGDIQSGISNIGTSLEEIADELTKLKEGGYIKNNISETVSCLKTLAQCYKDISNAISEIRDACLILARDFDIYSIESAFRILSQGFDNLSNAFYSLRRAADELDNAADELDGVSENADNAISKMQEGLEAIRDGANYLSDAVDELSEITDRLTADGAVKMPSASDIFGSDFDTLFDNMTDIRDEFSSLKDILKDKKDKLSDEFDNISGEIGALTDILSGTYDDKVSADADGFVEDISDRDSLGDTRGKIESSVNFGPVFGDINAAGIVGSMAIEYDFDPEDDIKKNGDKSLNFIYRTKCVVRRCKNEAAVSTKKNYSGGIVGRMDLGSVISCENYGNISNDDGDYTGGIAGMSDAAIRNSVSKCSLSGKDYVGGIAGQGSSVSNCYALVEVSDYGECAGSIAGSAERSGLNDNYFVSDTLGGIDDINYTGEAEETSIDTFVNFVKIGFGTDITFKLVFIADDKEIDTIAFRYKDAIPQERIPKVPEKAGYYGKWSYYNYDEAVFDAVITAQYYRDIDLIESELRRDNGKPVVLVCGAFDDSASVKAVGYGEYSGALQGRNIFDSYEVSIEGTYTEKYIVRYLPASEKNNIDIYIEYDGKTEKVRTKRFGSYLEFETTAGNFKLYETKKSHAGVIVLCVMLLALAGGGVVFVLKRRKKKEAINNVEQQN